MQHFARQRLQATSALSLSVIEPYLIRKHHAALPPHRHIGQHQQIGHSPDQRPRPRLLTPRQPSFPHASTPASIPATIVVSFYRERGVSARGCSRARPSEFSRVVGRQVMNTDGGAVPLRWASLTARTKGGSGRPFFRRVCTTLIQWPKTTLRQRARAAGDVAIAGDGADIALGRIVGARAPPLLAATAPPYLAATRDLFEYYYE